MKSDAIGSLFPGVRGLRGRESEGAEGVVEPIGGCLLDELPVECHALKLLDEDGSVGVDGTEGRLWGGEDPETGLAADDEARDDNGAVAVERRLCTTVFTVTRLVSLEGGSNGLISPGCLESIWKALPLFGIGGIIRAWYIVFCSWDAFVFVFSKRVFGCGFVAPDTMISPVRDCTVTL
jgi:hypothetical protein